MVFKSTNTRLEKALKYALLSDLQQCYIEGTLVFLTMISSWIQIKNRGIFKSRRDESIDRIDDAEVTIT